MTIVSSQPISSLSRQVILDRNKLIYFILKAVSNKNDLDKGLIITLTITTTIDVSPKTTKFLWSIYEEYRGFGGNMFPKSTQHLCGICSEYRICTFFWWKYVP